MVIRLGGGFSLVTRYRLLTFGHVSCTRLPFIGRRTNGTSIKLDAQRRPPWPLITLPGDKFNITSLF